MLRDRPYCVSVFNTLRRVYYAKKDVTFSAVVLIPKNTELDLRREIHLLAKGACATNGGTVMIANEPLSLTKINR